MNYSNGMMSVPCVFIESCKTTRVFAEGLSAAEAKSCRVERYLSVYTQWLRAMHTSPVST